MVLMVGDDWILRASASVACFVASASVVATSGGNKRYPIIRFFKGSISTTWLWKSFIGMFIFDCHDGDC